MNTLCNDEIFSICNFLDFNTIKTLGKVSVPFNDEINLIENINFKNLIRNITKYNNCDTPREFLDIAEKVIQQITLGSFKMTVEHHVNIYTFLHTNYDKFNSLTFYRNSTKLDFTNENNDFVRKYTDLITFYLRISRNDRGTKLLTHTLYTRPSVNEYIKNKKYKQYDALHFLDMETYSFLTGMEVEEEKEVEIMEIEEAFDEVDFDMPELEYEYDDDVSEEEEEEKYDDQEAYVRYQRHYEIAAIYNNTTSLKKKAKCVVLLNFLENNSVVDDVTQRINEITAIYTRTSSSEKKAKCVVLLNFLYSKQ